MYLLRIQSYYWRPCSAHLLAWTCVHVLYVYHVCILILYIVWYAQLDHALSHFSWLSWLDCSFGAVYGYHVC